jgi:DNA-binding GntR family transcriptional regulator
MQARSNKLKALPALEIAKLAAPLRAKVEEVLRQAIIEGRLAPGQRLTERQLTEMTGVSRTLIREALRQLESQGLISLIPNKGPVVRELTADECRDLYAIRAVLEGLAARYFVENADVAMATELSNAVDAVVAAYERGDFPAALKTKNHFYEVLFRGSGSETLSSMLQTLHARIWRWRALGVTHPQRSPGRAAEAIRGLKTIQGAIRRRDAAAADQATREEAMHGATEVMRLLAQDLPTTRRARL